MSDMYIYWGDITENFGGTIIIAPDYYLIIGGSNYTDSESFLRVS